MEVNGEIEEPARSEETIVLDLKPKKGRSPAQLEALKKAQETRREKIQQRAQKKHEPPPTPASSPTAESKPEKDYRAKFKAQKAELNALRFEKAVRERLMLETMSTAPAPTPYAPEPVPAVSAKPSGFGPGWTVGAPVRKKNMGW